MRYELAVWLVPLLVGASVFLAVCAIFWPPKRRTPAPLGTPYSFGYLGSCTEACYSTTTGNVDRPDDLDLTLNDAKALMGEAEPVVIVEGPPKRGVHRR